MTDCLHLHGFQSDISHARTVDHADTLRSQSELAVLLGHLGNLAAAEKLERHVFSVRVRSLGGTHPDTLVVMSNLGCTLRDSGRLQEAERVLDHNLR